MGKIYSWERIENDGVPNVENFSVAKRMILSDLSGLIPNEIYGAKVYGSVAKNSPSIRSDFDILVVFNNNLGVKKLNYFVQEIDKETKVQVEPLILSVQQASEGFHTIDSSFYTHFEGIPNEGNLIGNYPLNKIKPLQGNTIDVCMDYIRQKIRRLNQGHFDTSGVELLSVLQRVLESPVALGRKVLYVLQNLGKFEMDDKDDCKKSVIRNFNKIMVDSNIDATDFNEIVSKDKEYTEFLGETLGQKHNRSEYEQFLDVIKQETLPMAKDWIIKTGIWLKKIASS